MIARRRSISRLFSLHLYVVTSICLALGIVLKKGAGPSSLNGNEGIAERGFQAPGIKYVHAHVRLTWIVLVVPTLSQDGCV